MDVSICFILNVQSRLKFGEVVPMNQHLYSSIKDSLCKINLFKSFDKYIYITRMKITFESLCL